MADVQALRAAYSATTYQVDLPSALLDLRIGQSSSVLRGFLEAEGATSFAILSAHNPGSVLLGADENACRHRALEEDLRCLGNPRFSARNIPDTPEWPVEPGFFVLGPGLEAVLLLAERYGQNAIVQGGREGVPMLQWIKEMNTQ